MDSDRNLLFGVLALQADLIDDAQFARACSEWAGRKQLPLADLLVERGWLTSSDRADVEKLLERKLRKHKGDARASLAEVMPDPVKRSLAGLADPDIRQSLAGLTAPPEGLVLIATTAYEPGACDRYTLSRLHATGGIGRVWLARDASLGRDVALKELRPERAGSPAVWARFLKEAQVTGQLEHPGIVPIYELGRRPGDQQPFYTMRFVRGRTLAEAAAAYHRRRASGEAGPLELRELLTALVGVCNAVAYAHSRGVLHRDLKPQNVVLGDYGEVMVLDWGLARVTGERDDMAAPLELPAAGEADATVQGQVLGTPAYMAPEQAEGRLDLLGPATDVYGLGAILYEVLAGRPPFRGDDTAAVLRQVAHEAPPRPRSVEKGAPGALEAVCLKALAKSPAARYATAKELAAEVERWLADEQVSAYQDPLTTRVRRWAGRHRTVVSAAAVLLVAGMVGLSLGAFLLNRARQETERQRQEAVLARGRAEAVSHFLVEDLLNQADPENNPVGDKITVRELLDKAARAADTSDAIKASPGVEGAVRSALGTTYFGLGLYQRGREELERAVECQDRAPDVPASEQIFTKNRLCWVNYKLGSFDERMAREVLAEAREKLGPDHAETVYAADTLATITLGNGKREAFALYRENLATQQRVLGPEDPLTVRAAQNLADALMSNQQGDLPAHLDEALTVMLSVRDASRRLGPERLQGLHFENTLGFLYARQGKFGEARDVLAPLEEPFLRVLGVDHLDVALYYENWALAEEGLGRLDTAEASLRKAYTTRKNRLNESHGLTRRAAAHLGRVCLAQGKTEEAVGWLRVLIASGPVPTGPRPRLASRPPDAAPEDADADRLGDALAGKADPYTTVVLLHKVCGTLRWLTWRTNWLMAHVNSLMYEAACREDGMSKDEAGKRINDAIGVTRASIAIMEANPATPPRILDEARARLKRLVAADADGAPPK
jgi:tetratricopeptide (TPR) repeat protein